MKALATILWLAALVCGCTAQPFGTLTAAPTHPAPGIALNWTSGPSGTVVINRAPVGFAPAPIAMTTGTTFTDTTGAANTIYTYSVSQGASQSNTTIAVVSDLTQPFVCPFYPPVDPALFGVDRTETFQSADGSIVSFTIQAPQPGAFVSTISPCNGAGGCDDYTNMAAAIAAVKANGKGTVFANAGAYHFHPPTPAAFSNIECGFCTDVVITAPPLINDVPQTMFYFNKFTSTGGNSFGLQIALANRVLIANIGFDWDFPNAMPGVVTTVAGTQRFTVSNPTFYIPDPLNPPPANAITGYNTTSGTFIFQAGARPGANGTFNTNFAVDGLYYYTLSPGIFFPVGTQAIAWTSSGPNFSIDQSTNVSFEHVRVYGGASAGFTVTTSVLPTGNVRLTDYKATKKPASLLAPGEPARFVAYFGDNDLNGVTGGLLVENSEFGFIDDDLFALGGGFGKQLTSIVSTSEFTYQSASKPILHNQSSLDVFRFHTPNNLALIGSSAAASWTQTLVAGTWTLDVTLANPIPGLARYIGATGTGVPFAANVGWGNPNFVMRNNCGHDAHGRFLVGSGTGGLVENNTLANSFYGPIVWFWAPSFSGQVGANNLILRNNRIVGVDYGHADVNWLGTSTKGMMTGVPSAAVTLNTVNPAGFYPLARKNLSAFQIYNNFISNSIGLGILIAGGNNVGVVNNTIVDANAVAFQAGYDASFCGAMSLGLMSLGALPVCLATVAAQGSIMITNADNVDATSTPNTFLGTSGGLFTTPSIATDNIVGSRFIH